MSDLDTRTKRASSVQLMSSWVLAPPAPDATIDTHDRQQIAWTYAGAIAVGQAAGDTVVLTEQLTRQTQRSIAEQISLTEASLLEAQKTLTETASLSETLDTLKIALASVSDTVSLLESLSLLTDRQVAELVNLTEVLQFSVSVGTVDTLELTEALNAVKVILSDVGDVLELTETLETEVIGPVETGESHYEIQLFFGRQLVVSEIEYEYRWEANSQDFGADGARHLIIEVQGRTADGRLGDIAKIEVQNPAPDMHAIEPIIRSFPESVFVDWSNFVPLDFDFDHYDVIVSFVTAEGEEPLEGRTYRRGRTQNNVIIPTKVPIFFQIVPYDAFGVGIPTRVFEGSPA